MRKENFVGMTQRNRWQIVTAGIAVVASFLAPTAWAQSNLKDAKVGTAFRPPGGGELALPQKPPEGGLPVGTATRDRTKNPTLGQPFPTARATRNQTPQTLTSREPDIGLSFPAEVRNGDTMTVVGTITGKSSSPIVSIDINIPFGGDSTRYSQRVSAKAGAAVQVSARLLVKLRKLAVKSHPMRLSVYVGHKDGFLAFKSFNFNVLGDAVSKAINTAGDAAGGAARNRK